MSDNPENLPTIYLDDTEPARRFSKGERYRQEIQPNVFVTITQRRDLGQFDPGKRSEPTWTDARWVRSMAIEVMKFDKKYRGRVIETALNPNLDVPFVMELLDLDEYPRSSYFRLVVSENWADSPPSTRALFLYNLAFVNRPKQSRAKRTLTDTLTGGEGIQIRPNLLDGEAVAEGVMKTVGRAAKDVLKGFIPSS